jgi:hypothetical protein
VWCGVVERSLTGHVDAVGFRVVSVGTGLEGVDSDGTVHGAPPSSRVDRADVSSVARDSAHLLRDSPGQVVPVPNSSRSSATHPRRPGASHIAGFDERDDQAFVVSGILAGRLLPGVEWLLDREAGRPDA